MKNLLKQNRKKMIEISCRFRDYISGILKDERGEGPLSTILFVAIVILAIFLVSDTIQDAFADVANYFEKTIIGKVKDII